MANALYPKWKEAIIQASASSALNGSGTTGVYAALEASESAVMSPRVRRSVPVAPRAPMYGRK